MGVDLIEVKRKFLRNLARCAKVFARRVAIASEVVLGKGVEISSDEEMCIESTCAACLGR